MPAPTKMEERPDGSAGSPFFTILAPETRREIYLMAFGGHCLYLCWRYRPNDLTELSTNWGDFMDPSDNETAPRARGCVPSVPSQTAGHDSSGRKDDCVSNRRWNERPRRPRLALQSHRDFLFPPFMFPASRDVKATHNEAFPVLPWLGTCRRA